MTNPTKTKHVLGSSMLVSGALILLGAPACGGGADGSTYDAPDTGEVTGVSEEAFSVSHWLPWRGAAAKNLNVPAFGSDFAVFAVDIGVTNLCTPRSGCTKAITGLQLWWITSRDNTPQSTRVGTPSASSWTRQQCPGTQFVSGYNIGIGKLTTAKTHIQSLGMICTERTSHAGTNMPVLGESVLFPEALDCSGQFTTDPIRWLGAVSMNAAGDGMQGMCVKP